MSLVKYHKIKAPFERSTETKKLTDVCALDEFGYLADLDWIWTEKVDGTNIRVYWDGYQLSLHGRNDNSQIPAEFIEYYYQTFIYSGLDKIIEQEFGEREVIFFGEGFGGKIQNGGKYGKTRFILFDVMVGGYYSDRACVEHYAKQFNLECVPTVLVGTLQDAIDYVKTCPKSTLGDLTMEGAVGTPMYPLYTKFRERIITKVKVNDFKDWNY
jgi:hypothetical protein